MLATPTKAEALEHTPSQQTSPPIIRSGIMPAGFKNATANRVKDTAGYHTSFFEPIGALATLAGDPSIGALATTAADIFPETGMLVEFKPMTAAQALGATEPIIITPKGDGGSVVISINPFLPPEMIQPQLMVELTNLAEKHGRTASRLVLKHTTYGKGGLMFIPAEFEIGDDTFMRPKAWMESEGTILTLLRNLEQNSLFATGVNALSQRGIVNSASQPEIHYHFLPSHSEEILDTLRDALARGEGEDNPHYKTAQQLARVVKERKCDGPYLAERISEAFIELLRELIALTEDFIQSAPLSSIRFTQEIADVIKALISNDIKNIYAEDYLSAVQSLLKNGAKNLKKFLTATRGQALTQQEVDALADEEEKDNPNAKKIDRIVTVCEQIAELLSGSEKTLPLEEKLAYWQSQEQLHFPKARNIATYSILRKYRPRIEKSLEDTKRDIAKKHYLSEAVVDSIQIEFPDCFDPNSQQIPHISITAPCGIWIQYGQEIQNQLTRELNKIWGEVFATSMILKDSEEPDLSELDEIFGLSESIEELRAAGIPISKNDLNYRKVKNKVESTEEISQAFLQYFLTFFQYAERESPLLHNAAVCPRVDDIQRHSRVNGEMTRRTSPSFFPEPLADVKDFEQYILPFGIFKTHVDNRSILVEGEHVVKKSGAERLSGAVMERDKHRRTYDPGFETHLKREADHHHEEFRQTVRTTKFEGMKRHHFMFYWHEALTAANLPETYRKVLEGINDELIANNFEMAHELQALTEDEFEAACITTIQKHSTAEADPKRILDCFKQAWRDRMAPEVKSQTKSLPFANVWSLVEEVSVQVAQLMQTVAPGLIETKESTDTPQENPNDSAASSPEQSLHWEDINLEGHLYIKYFVHSLIRDLEHNPEDNPAKLNAKFLDRLVLTGLARYIFYTAYEDEIKRLRESAKNETQRASIDATVVNIVGRIASIIGHAYKQHPGSFFMTLNGAIKEENTEFFKTIFYDIAHNYRLMGICDEELFKLKLRENPKLKTTQIGKIKQLAENIDLTAINNACLEHLKLGDVDEITTVRTEIQIRLRQMEEEYRHAQTTL